jgi:signal transduction histidine kinase
MGFSSLLLGTELSDEQRRLANSLHSSIESLLAVVNDVLDVSALEAGAMRLESAGFNLIALIRGVADMFSETALAKGLVVRVDTDGVKHPNVMGDPGRMRQILANFISNAAKFTDAGYVALRAATRGVRNGAVEVSVSVTDTVQEFRAAHKDGSSSRSPVSLTKASLPNLALAWASRSRNSLSS